MIRLAQVTKSFGPKEVLRGIDLTVETGESLVVIGGSGTGKSVLLKCILGLVKPDGGTIELDGTDVTKGDRDAFLARFGMLFQGGALFDSMPIWQNVAFRLLRGPGKRPKAGGPRDRHRETRPRGLGQRRGRPLPRRAFGRHAKTREPCARHRRRARDHLLRRTHHRPRPDHVGRHQRSDPRAW
jgi:phospholipid/cholesterol/gamma-HCH transport system ATP-binding protein